MKMNGREIKGPNVEYIVIPRQNGDLIFKAQAILSMDYFHSLVPIPKPQIMVLPTGERKPIADDPGYKSQVKDYSDKRFDYMIITSLQATEGLEWSTVQYTNPDTWKNYETELKESGFTFQEIQLIVGGVLAANSLNEEKLKEAKDRFLATLASTNQSAQSLLEEGEKTTPSGELVKGSE